MESLHGGRRRLRGATPHHDREAEPSQIAGHTLADFAKAQNADRHVLRATLTEPLPDSVALLIEIGFETPLMPDHMPDDKTRHHLRLLRIDDANDVNVRPQAGTGNDVVDARADRADRLQIGIALKGVVRRMPRDR